MPSGAVFLQLDVSVDVLVTSPLLVLRNGNRKLKRGKEFGRDKGAFTCPISGRFQPEFQGWLLSPEGSASGVEQTKFFNSVLPCLRFKLAEKPTAFFQTPKQLKRAVRLFARVTFLCTRFERDWDGCPGRANASS